MKQIITGLLFDAAKAYLGTEALGTTLTDSNIWNTNVTSDGIFADLSDATNYHGWTTLFCAAVVHGVAHLKTWNACDLNNDGVYILTSPRWYTEQPSGVAFNWCCPLTKTIDEATSYSGYGLSNADDMAVDSISGLSAAEWGSRQQPNYPANITYDFGSSDLQYTGNTTMLIIMPFNDEQTCPNEDDG